MKLTLGCELSYEVVGETVFIFNVEVARLDAHRALSERLSLTPEFGTCDYIEPELLTRYTRVVAAPGSFSLRYEAEVDLQVVRADPAGLLEVPVKNLPLKTLPYLLPSRFVPSDRLAAFALREFGGLAPGHERVTAICNWIYDNIAYQRGSSDSETTAAESLIARAGVCRDFAHLGISFCRALGIPARFVTCYALGLQPPDFHAVFEAYLGDRWWLFDATRQAALDGLVRIGIGRDAAEVAFATPFGDMTPGPVKVWIDQADGAGEAAERTAEAISTAGQGA